MKKVTELNWEPHSAGCGGERAVETFPNRYFASCIRGGPFYTKNGTYEIAVCHPDTGVCYDTPITSDVLGYLSEEEANQALIDIAALPPR